jgi:hypothetical protein
MKKHLFFILILTINFSAFAQESTGEQTSKNRRFFVGAAYSYMSVDMKLTDMSLHSVWYGQDQGTHDLTGEEIDELNDQFERNSRINALMAEFGWWIMKKPETRWQVNGKIFAGIAQSYSNINNKSGETQEITFNSGFSKPCLGLGAGVGYRFSDRWELNLNPVIVGTMGSSDEITDKTHPDPVNFQSEKENNYRTLVGRLDLQVTFRAGPVNIYAGPGIYRICSWHDYTRTYSEGDPEEVITEEMTTRIVNRSWLVATAGVSWEIIPQLTLFAKTGLGSDISFDGGIQFNF